MIVCVVRERERGGEEEGVGERERERVFKGQNTFGSSTRFGSAVLVYCSSIPHKLCTAF